MKFSRNTLQKVLLQLPKKHHSNFIKIPIHEPVGVIGEADPGPIGYIEEITFVWDDNDRDWVLHEITTGGRSISF